MKEHRGRRAKPEGKMSGRVLKNHQAKEETISLNRKAMVLAVGAALAAPSAYSQTSDKWEIYGKFYPELTHASGEGATAASTTVSALAATGAGASGLVSRWEMQVNNTYIGFRGSRN